MTIQSRLFLRKLRKAQISEGGSVYIDFDAMTASTVCDATAPCKTVKLNRFKDSARPILSYLEKLELVSCDGLGYVEVLHKGWHPSQKFVFDFCGFMLKSVLVPISVSVATTLLTIWITGFFK